MTLYNSRDVSASELKMCGVSLPEGGEVMTGSRRLASTLVDGLVRTIVNSEEVIESLKGEKPFERARRLEKALSHGLCDDGNVPYSLLSDFAIKIEKETGIEIDLSEYSK